MSSDLDSDLEFNIRTPSVEDQLTDLQHFVNDLRRKLENMEDKIIQTQEEIYRLQVIQNNQLIFNTKITTFFVYILTITTLLLILNLLP